LKDIEMRMIAAVAFSSAIVLTPVLAAAQQTASAAAPAAPVASDNTGTNLDEVVCKNSPPPTGSRLGGGRECHSQREWNERQQEAQRALLRLQTIGHKVPGG
jgi:hypothetical protein